MGFKLTKPQYSQSDIQTFMKLCRHDARARATARPWVPHTINSQNPSLKWALAGGKKEFTYKKCLYLRVW